MIKIFKYLILVSIVLALLHFYIHQTFAQTCGGTTASQCVHTQYDVWSFGDDQGDTCYECHPFNPPSGFSCNINSAQYGCGACVPALSDCQENNGVAATLNGFPITCSRNFSDVDIQWFKLFPNGSCGDTEDFCTTGCTTYCNSGAVYGSCNGLSEPYNHCGTAFGSQSCTYTQPQTCTNTSCGTRSCSDSYNNCDGGLGYACGSGNVCRKTMGGKVTNAETGAGIPNITITTTAGNDVTDANGNWSVGGFAYQSAFTITPSSSGTPCNAGYVCGGTNPTSPNPGSRSGTIGGGGDCTTNCNFTYTPGHIAGHVYIDYNHNGTKDAEDVGIANVALGANNPNKTDTTDANGAYDIGNLNDGAHTVTITVPAGYQIVGSTTQNVTIGPNATTIDFFITPLYTLSGIVYNDLDAGKCYNPSTSGCTDKSANPDVVHGAGSDTPYTASQTTVTIVGDGQTRTSNQSTGIYTTNQVLRSGTYTVTLTTIPTDYHEIYPKNAVPGFFTVTIGTPGKSSACNTNGYNDANCDGSGNMTTLNFGINNENSHGGGVCEDVRDETSTSQFIPDTASCGVLSGKYYIFGNNSCPTGPGIYFSGTETPDFGHGTANANNWLAGGATSESFSPVNPGVIRTANSYLETTLNQNGITATDLSTVCTPSNCYLPDNLPSGVYSYPFDTTFVGTKVSGGGTVDGTYTFPTGKNYVFVTGDSSHQSDMTFSTKILVPNGSSATFVASKDIIVDPSVGESNITSTKGDLEGFYSADESFIIDSDYTSDNRCTDSGGTKDLRFNLIGSVVVNAAGNGGSFTNNRDLCAGDLSCPTYTTGLGDGGDNGTCTAGDVNGACLGLTYILNAPDLIKHKNTFWQELAP